MISFLISNYFKKRTNLTSLNLQYRPPFVVIHEKSLNQLEVKTSEVLEIFLILQKPKEAKGTCLKINGKFCT